MMPIVAKLIETTVTGHQYLQQLVDVRFGSLADLLTDFSLMSAFEG